VGEVPFDQMTGAQQIRRIMDRWSDHIGEWQGVPVPVDGLRIRLSRNHPLAEKITAAEDILYPAEVPERTCHDDEGRVVLVNSWFSHSRHATVLMLRDQATGKPSVIVEPVSPDQSMRRLTFALRTIGAIGAWSVEAEANAMSKLVGLLNWQQVQQYILAGQFLETSKRSGVTYLFRRLRPTVAMTSRNGDPANDMMRCLAVLCLHPVGYYADSWAGCMTPSDDVIAHLMLMRGDEPGFWRQASQHPAWSPEAGL
jgi:hypothetical protein